MEAQGAIGKQEVVEVIDKFRKGLDTTETAKYSRPGVLRTNNVSTKKVVDIINEHRKERRSTSYQKYLSPLNITPDAQLKLASPKVEELKSIFMDASEGMEWEKIDNETKMELKKRWRWQGKIKEDFLKQDNGFTDLGGELKERLIEKAEDHVVNQEYMKLNSGFVKRVKDENREVDIRNVNEKRAQKSQKKKIIRRREELSRKNQIQTKLKSRDTHVKSFYNKRKKVWIGFGVG